MKAQLRFFALAASLTIGVSAAFAQSTDTTQGSTDQGSTEQSTTSTTVGSFRSDGAAIASILSRRSPEEGQAIIRTLTNIEQHSADAKLGRNTGFNATENLIVRSASSSDQDIVRTAWSNMEDFDRQALTILARSAYFGGLDQTVDGGQERPLRFFQSDSSWWTTTRAQGLVVQSPNMRALDTVTGKFGASGDAFRNAIMSIQANQSTGGMRNLGYVNAEKVLMDAIGASDRDAFQSAWNGLDASDREGALILVREAVFGGLNKL